MPITLISNAGHYTRVLAHCADAKYILWIGTADIKEAYIEMKGEGTRNFETGILTDDPTIVEQAMNQFDDVWMG